MQQEECRDCTGGITVPIHSSTTSKGSPLRHPPSGWVARAPVLPAHTQLSISYLGTSAMVKLNGCVSQGQGHLFPLTWGRVPGCSLPTGKAGGDRGTGVFGVAQHNVKKQHYVCVSKEMQGAAETSCVKTYDCPNTRTKCFMSNNGLLNQIQAKQKQTKKKIKQTN